MADKGARKMDPIIRALAERHGIVFMGASPSAQLQPRQFSLRFAHDGGIACDAQPAMISQSNAGIPAFLSTFFDPKLIEVLLAPMKAAEIVGDEVKKGDWTTETAMFLMVESTGQTTAYGDYSESGDAGVNVNYPQRQSFHYQVMTSWGERELARAALSRIDWANRKSIASALTLNKYQNKSYFFGISGLENYGFLNDPSLTPSISPTTKAAGNGNVWIFNGAPNAVSTEVLADIQKLYSTLQTQLNGLVELDTKMTLAMSPGSEVAMTITNQYNVSVYDQIKKNYPGITIKTAPEYATTSGNLVQLFVEELEGQRTASCAFTEKMRAHPIIVQSSSFKQKKSQGTWGCIVFRPAAIASMLGV
jgi:hypothetical protein